MDAFFIVIKGILVGVANVIPGVSGGTLALMLGIYKRIMDALRRLDLELFRKALAVVCLRRGAWDAFWRHAGDADVPFLAWLGGGAVVAILLTSRLIAAMLARYHSASYAFFLGLVLCSIVFPWRYLSRRSWREAVSLLLAAALTIGLSMSVPDDVQIEKAQRKHEMALLKADTSGTVASVLPAAVPHERAGAGRLGIIFLSAILAISAMVLPGISGSFVLLLLGVYFDILAAVNNRDLLVIGIFALGALVGLLVFSRMMGALLNRFFNITMAFMTGLMAGSLYALWPFKRVVQVGGESLYLSNVWRGATAGEEFLALAAFATGCVVVSGFSFLSRGRERSWNSVLK